MRLPKFFNIRHYTLAKNPSKSHPVWSNKSKTLDIVFNFELKRLVILTAKKESKDYHLKMSVPKCIYEKSKNSILSFEWG